MDLYNGKIRLSFTILTSSQKHYDLKFLFISGNIQFMVNVYVQKYNSLFLPKSLHVTSHLHEWEFQVPFYRYHSVSEGLSAFLGS